MNIVETYLFILQEKLEDIKINEKDRKWYDIINRKVKDKYKTEIEKILKKNFKINHSMVDNKKTIIDVKPALFRMLFDIQITLFTKTGENIHDRLIFRPQPLSFHVFKKKDKWNVYFSMLFIKEKFQKQGLSKAIISEMERMLRLIQKQREMTISAVDIGIYAWSRIEGCQFLDEGQHKVMQKAYESWEIKNKNPTPKILKNPVDYPKEFLLSDSAPLVIEYKVPF